MRSDETACEIPSYPVRTSEYAAPPDFNVNLLLGEDGPRQMLENQAQCCGLDY